MANRVNQGPGPGVSGNPARFTPRAPGAQVRAEEAALPQTRAELYEQRRRSGP